MNKLLNFYIIHKESGISYNPTYVTSSGTIMTAIANTALNKEIVINVQKLIAGLREKRYRLIPKPTLSF